MSIQDKDIRFLCGENHLAATIRNVTNNRKSPIAVLAHGFGGDRHGGSLEIANKLAQKGISSFRFDFYGHGESDGEFEDITISEGTQNILSALAYLKNESYENISLIGTSFGGACSILAASQCDYLQALALRAPVADYFIRTLMTFTKEEIAFWENKGFRQKAHDLKGKGSKYLKKGFLDDMKKINGFIAAEKIKIPTGIVHGSSDTSVPLVLSEMLQKVISDCELKIIEGADHKFTNPEHLDQAFEYLAEFINLHVTKAQ